MEICTKVWRGCRGGEERGVDGVWRGCLCNKRVDTRRFLDLRVDSGVHSTTLDKAQCSPIVTSLKR
eukprot:5396518-Pyramimonas_sp.AAC.1